MIELLGPHPGGSGHRLRRQELLDLAERRGVPLDPERAVRAAAAGRAQELAERIRSQPARR